MDRLNDPWIGVDSMTTGGCLRLFRRFRAGFPMLLGHSMGPEGGRNDRYRVRFPIKNLTFSQGRTHGRIPSRTALT